MDSEVNMKEVAKCKCGGYFVPIAQEMEETSNGFKQTITWKCVECGKEVK